MYSGMYLLCPSQRCSIHRQQSWKMFSVNGLMTISEFLNREGVACFTSIKCMPIWRFYAVRSIAMVVVTARIRMKRPYRSILITTELPRLLRCKIAIKHITSTDSEAVSLSPKFSAISAIQGKVGTIHT